jgi:large repetitive protein
VRLDVGNRTQYTWTNLTNGTAYTFRVAAENGAGITAYGPASAPETPARAPDTPAAPGVNRGSNRVDLTWTEPVLNGAPVLEYEVRIDPGGTTTTVGTGTSYTWSSLPNGFGVKFQVRARNKAGWSPWSPLSAEIVPCGLPEVPGGVAAVRGDRSATISWTSPNPQGCVVTQYELKSSAGASQFATGEASLSAVGVSRNHVFSSLVNGTAYTFQVRARNDVGWGPWTTPTAGVVPAGLPGRPTLTATGGVREVTVSWTTPSDNGSPILRYEITSSGVTRTATSSPYTWTGLGNATTYTFSIRAVNDVGSGSSDSDSATTIGVPGQVGGLSAVPGDGRIDASWSSPASTGGSPITGYEVSITGGGTVTTTSRSRAFTGLSNGTSYTVTVRACNAAGCGSPASASATPWPPKRITVSKGAVHPRSGDPDYCSGTCYRVGVSITGFAPNQSITVVYNGTTGQGTTESDWCIVGQTRYGYITTNSSGSGSTSECYWGNGGSVWAEAGGVNSLPATPF